MDKSILLYQEQIGCTIDVLAMEIQLIANSVAKNPLVTSRVKDPKTLEKKMQKKNLQSVFLIDDVYGIRIIVESVDETYEVLKKMLEVFPGYLDHDYIKEPKVRINKPHKGKVLRLLQFIAYKNDIPFEIQITTFVFHAMNELLHEGYHRKKYQSSDL